MFVLNETGVDFKAADSRSKQLVTQLLAHTPRTREGIKISSSQVIFPSSEHKGRLYLLKDGMLSYSVDGQTIFYYESGDLVGLEHLLTRSTGVVQSDFAVVVDQIDGLALLKQIGEDAPATRALQELLSLQSVLLSQLCFKVLKASAEAPPEIRTFADGDTILAAGTDAEEVFTLVEGAAQVHAEESVQATLDAGDVFGVVAALNGVQQPVSVRSKGSSTVVVIPKDTFVKMIESRPATMLQAIEEMARTLVLNDGQMPPLSLSRY